jgi:raffinose/stachyose/melibiose transport system permease protein
MDKIKKAALNILTYSVLAFTVAVSIFPLLWVVMSSFKTNGEILSSPFSLPSGFNFEPYLRVLDTSNFAMYGFNSLVIAFTATFGSLVIYAMGAYVIAKYRFPGKSLFFALFTITMLVPGHTKTQPIFSLIMNLNLYDTKQGLILVYLSGGMAMSMFVLRSAFASIPKEMSEAATIDGAGFFRTFWQMHLPLAKSGLATAGIMMFLGNWNEYYFAALLTSSTKNRTLPYALAFFNEAFAYDYTRMFAALTLVILPGILIYIFSQEQVQMSVVSSGVKG